MTEKCFQRRQDELWKYYSNYNYTFNNKAFLKFGNAINEHYEFANSRDIVQNSIIIHLKFMKPEIDFIDVKYTFMDKLATFGGNFGIFEMVTGWSLFGILNIILLTFKCLFKFNNLPTIHQQFTNNLPTICQQFANNLPIIC